MARSSPFVRQGLPLIAMVVLGSVGLSTVSAQATGVHGAALTQSQLVGGKQELGDARKQKRSLTVREYDMEQDYQKTMAKLQLDSKDLEIVRIPRDPGETE